MRDGNLDLVSVVFVGDTMLGRCLLDGTMAKELSLSATKMFCRISIFEAFLLTGDEG